jgi:hypothetical protein
MPLSKAEWTELRAKIALEPEGSPARIVLAEYDHVWGAWRDERAQAAIAFFRSNDHLTTEEATRLVDYYEDNPLRMENGPCRACQGVGRVPHNGCIGGVLERCTVCNGKKKGLRVQLPWDPHGEPLTFAGDPVETPKT